MPHTPSRAALGGGLPPAGCGPERIRSVSRVRRSPVRLLAAALASAALLAPVTAAPPQRRQVAVTVYGAERCPPSTGDEIVVCAREPESERFRIPRKLREQAKDRRAAAAWGARVAATEDATRFTRPDGCSPVGSFGQSGCTAAAIRSWYAERRAARAAAAGVP